MLLDSMDSKHQFVIMISNVPEILDPAIRDRMTVDIVFSLPDKQTLKKYVLKTATTYGLSPKNKHIKALIDSLDKRTSFRCVKRALMEIFWVRHIKNKYTKDSHEWLVMYR